MLVWLAISLSIGSLLLIDVAMTRRNKHQFTISDAAIQSAFWISIALALGFYIYFTFEYGHLSIFKFAGQDGGSLNGKEAVSQYFTIYFLERSLNFDNVFIILIIFQALKIPAQYQYRILFYGIIIAIIARVVFISIGVNLLAHFSWLNYFIAVLILMSAVKLIAHTTLPLKNKHTGLASFLMAKLPVNQYSDNLNSPQSDSKSKRFFLRQNGKRFVSPLLIALLCVEYTDLVFSFDSIPAALSISNNLFIIISASILSLVGLRALYFVFASVLAKLRYIKFALVTILIILAVRSALFDIYPIPPNILLLVMSIIIILGTVLSLMHHDRNEQLDLPFIENIGRLYEITYTTIRRLVVTLVGVSVIIVGIIMIVTPGPAIIVIPAGLAILATEFLWARLLLIKVKNKLIHYGKETKEYFKRNEKNDK